jgi:hypothetical protein
LGIAVVLRAELLGTGCSKNSPDATLLDILKEQHVLCVRSGGVSPDSRSLC